MQTHEADSAFSNTMFIIEASWLPMAKAKTTDTDGSTAVPTLEQYVEAFCDAPLTRKAVMDLSAMLARVVAGLIQPLLPEVEILTGHRSFGGAVSQHHLDAFAFHPQVGLKLGIDVKGLNSPTSAGKNWNNRVGDLANLANSHHQHAPKAVMGGVLVIPYEGITTSTLGNIERTMAQMGGRIAWNNAHGQFEAISLLVINKSKRCVVNDIPAPNSVLRIERFAELMATAYKQRWIK